MVVAHDTVTRWPSSGTDVNTGDQTFTHTPISSTPSGVVIAMCGLTTTLPATGILYGTAQMSLTVSATDSAEVGQVRIYTLTGQDVPTGAQTVTVQGTTANQKFLTCSTVTANTAATSLHTTASVGTTTSTDPQITWTQTASALGYGATHSGVFPFTGLTIVAGNIAQNGVDYVNSSARTCRRTTADNAGSVTMGWTAASDDWCMAAVAIAEILLPDVNMAPRIPT